MGVEVRLEHARHGQVDSGDALPAPTTGAASDPRPAPAGGRPARRRGRARPARPRSPPGRGRPSSPSWCWSAPVPAPSRTGTVLRHVRRGPSAAATAQRTRRRLRPRRTVRSANPRPAPRPAAASRAAGVGTEPDELVVGEGVADEVLCTGAAGEVGRSVGGGEQRHGVEEHRGSAVDRVVGSQAAAALELDRADRRGDVLHHCAGVLERRGDRVDQRLVAAVGHQHAELATRRRTRDR